MNGDMTILAMVASRPENGGDLSRNRCGLAMTV
jgi:hypothetical protein